jgi:hypothetical protein
MPKERVFAAADGRLWGASIEAGSSGADATVLVFACMSEARQGVRAITIEPPVELRDLTDDALRQWLAVAPRVKKLV